MGGNATITASCGVGISNEYSYAMITGNICVEGSTFESYDALDSDVEDTIAGPFISLFSEVPRQSKTGHQPHLYRHRLR